MTRERGFLPGACLSSQQRREASVVCALHPMPRMIG